MSNKYSQIDRDKAFSELCKELAELHRLKDADYDGAFESSLDEFGLMHSAAMLKHKCDRFKNIIEKKKINVSNESLKDTLMDMASYAIMTIGWLDFHNKEV